MVSTDEIVVIGGKYKGARGVIVGETNKMFYIQIFGHCEKKCIRKSLVTDEQSTQITELSATVANLAVQIREISKELHSLKQDFISMKQEVEGLQSFVAEYHRKVETIRNMMNQDRDRNL
jgi:uncharacterized protein YlxW (UPF0749 family)